MEEMISIEVNKTCLLDEFPEGKKTIGVKRVYKVKLNPKQEVTRQKVRFIVKGFLHEEWINFYEVFDRVDRFYIGQQE